MLQRCPVRLLFQDSWHISPDSWHGITWIDRLWFALSPSFSPSFHLSLFDSFRFFQRLFRISIRAFILEERADSRHCHAILEILSGIFHFSYHFLIRFFSFFLSFFLSLFLSFFLASFFFFLSLLLLSFFFWNVGKEESSAFAFRQSRWRDSLEILFQRRHSQTRREFFFFGPIKDSSEFLRNRMRPIHTERKWWITNELSKRTPADCIDCAIFPFFIIGFDYHLSNTNPRLWETLQKYSTKQPAYSIINTTITPSLTPSTRAATTRAAAMTTTTKLEQKRRREKSFWSPCLVWVSWWVEMGVTVESLTIMIDDDCRETVRTRLVTTRTGNVTRNMHHLIACYSFLDSFDRLTPLHQFRYDVAPLEFHS